MELLTWEKFAVLKGLDETGDSSVFDLLEEMVRSRFQTYLEREFGLEERTQIISKGSTDGVLISDLMLPLRGIPILSVAAVEVSYYDAAIQSTTAVDITSSATVRSTSGVYVPSYTTLPAEYAVTYTGGLVATNGTLERAAFLQISEEWERRFQPGANSTQGPGGRTTLGSFGLLPEVKETLASLIHPWKY
jgi:hypothetical protein